MIANGLTTLIGLYLAYLSIFGVAAASAAHWQEAVAGAAIVVLARLARQSDVSGWQSATNTALGALLALAALASWLLSFSPLMLFWIDLWIGLIAACLALWATLYHPERAPATQALAAGGQTGHRRA